MTYKAVGLVFTGLRFEWGKPRFRVWVVKTNRRLIGLFFSKSFGGSGGVTMAPLKHLGKENPIIDACFRDFCASHGILTGSVLYHHLLLVPRFLVSILFDFHRLPAKRLWLA